MDRIIELTVQQGRNRVFLNLRQRGERLILGEDSSRLMDGAPNPRIRPAAAEVLIHGVVDRFVIRIGIGTQQRNGGQGLARLTVTALHDVAGVPGRADGIHDGAGDALHGNDRLSDNATNRNLA